MAEALATQSFKCLDFCLGMFLQNQPLYALSVSFESIFSLSSLLIIAVVKCPPLPKDSVGSYNPIKCDEDRITFNTLCTLTCPDGYYISKHQKADARTCLTNGTWEYRSKAPRCKGIVVEIVR